MHPSTQALQPFARSKCVPGLAASPPRSSKASTVACATRIKKKTGKKQFASLCSLKPAASLPQDGTSPYMGAVVGRVANRIAKARFELDGVEYKLYSNNGPNCLHGGKVRRRRPRALAAGSTAAAAAACNAAVSPGALLLSAPYGDRLCSIQLQQAQVVTPGWYGCGSCCMYGWGKPFLAAGRACGEAFGSGAALLGAVKNQVTNSVPRTGPDAAHGYPCNQSGSCILSWRIRAGCTAGL
jgi:hypothetical protein